MRTGQQGREEDEESCSEAGITGERVPDFEEMDLRRRGGVSGRRWREDVTARK